MYADKNLKVIPDNKGFVSSDGTQYPRNYPKDEISGLTLVSETPRPDDPLLNVTGFIIDEEYNQVWQTEPKPAKQLADEAMRDWENQISDFDEVMPRSMEEHIANHHNGLTGDPFTQAKYDEKIDLRGRKPPGG